LTNAPRVLMVSKACVVGIYQRKLEDLARLGIDLTVVVPPSWVDERGEQRLERVYTDGYRLEVLPIRRNGDFHLHSYVGLGELVRELRPDIVHIDEEPYNLAAWQCFHDAKRVGAKTLFFSWQNLVRRYPPPFSWGERWLLRGVDYALMGTDSAAEVWRAKGYTGRLAVIPQFGTDPDLFQPAPRPDRPFTVGYFGRLVEEKGVSLLLDALAGLSGDWRAVILGGGPQRDTLVAQAEAAGIAGRVTWLGQVASTDMPNLYHRIDTLALPSLTRPNWKEQFGRVLVEAMCSGVPVVGSDSGAIPSVVGDAGLVVPEGDVSALRGALARLRDEPGLAAHFASAGRARALAHFTQRAVAEATADVYHEMLDM
jgi:glycosyltransferase involved in cell wall biosynthesis